MGDEHDYDERDPLRRREDIADSVRSMLDNGDPMGAMYLVDNLPGSDQKGALYAGIATDVARRLDNLDKKEDTKAYEVGETLLGKLKAKAPDYFGQEHQ